MKELKYMLQMAEKEIKLKDVRIKELEAYIALLESKGVGQDDKEIQEQRKKVQAIKAMSGNASQP